MICGSVWYRFSRSSGPASRPAAGMPTGVWLSMASFSECVRGVSGISCLGSSEPKARCTTGFNVGVPVECCNGSGRIWPGSVRSWGKSSGTGRQPTVNWARRDSGGKKVGKNPTDRGKNGTKKSILVDGDGGPLAAIIAAANVNDHCLLRQTIEAVVIERPTPTPTQAQHLCLDAAYDNPASREVTAATGYVDHIVIKEKEKRHTQRRKGQRARRWVVERTLAWLSKCRGILVRYDKKDTNYLGLIQFVCALFWYRRLYRLGRKTKEGQQKPS